MKTPYLLLFSALLFACKPVTEKPDTHLDFTKNFPLAVPEQNSLMAKWEKKSVTKTMMIDDMESDGNWKVTGIGEMEYTTERAKDGKRSLRFRTQMRDEDYYREHRTPWNSFGGGQGGNSSVILEFKDPQDWSAYNRISFWVYVHPTTMLTYCLHLSFKGEDIPHNATSPRYSHFIQDLKPGQWNHVMFEFPQLKRDKITSFAINQMLRGHNPEEEGIVTYDIDQLELQVVDADQFEGWTVSPETFAFSQAGYRPGDPKVAMVGNGASDKFELIDPENKVVYSGTVKNVTTGKGNFNRLDFSDFTTPGEYRIRCGNLESGSFPIDKDIWLNPVYSALNFFFCERCGYDVPGIHRECHKDWQGFLGDVKKIINGGWHDAGDLSQGSWRTSMASYAMMQTIEQLENQKADTSLINKFYDELKWGLAYLLKSRFGNGYHMSFSVMRIYTDNEVGTIDDVLSPARNIPWENFLTAAVQSKAAMLLEKSDPGLANDLKTAALEDWQAANDSCREAPVLDYREASWGITSSLLLHQLTGNDNYLLPVHHYASLLVQSQEQKFLDSIPIAGYFYTASDRKNVIHNYHTAFEEAPMIALSMLCDQFPDDADWMKWYSAVVLHSEYFMKRGSKVTAPYNYLPNSVWNRSEIMAVKDADLRADMLRQFNDGTSLGNDYVLRTFPIYMNDLFHGATNIQMSETWALAEASLIRHDPEGMRLVGKQFRWVLGDNPFGQSLMYGVGYDFAPQFAYCLKDVVGSLPVGMDCMSKDEPDWSASNDATHKEIWVEPVNRFMGAMSIYNSVGPDFYNENGLTKEVKIKAEKLSPGGNSPKINLVLTGSGKHELEILSFNAKAGGIPETVELEGNKPVTLPVEITIPDKDIPWVVVVRIDHDPDQRIEITGSLIDAQFTDHEL